MSKFKDITGQKFGKLTVLSYAHNDNKRSHWLCSCECGKTNIVSTTHLTSGNTQSCGCLYRKGDRVDSTWRVLYHSHEKGAYKRGLTPLTREQYRSWLETNLECIHCGSAPRERISKNGDPVLAHGIDRIDSSLDYSPTNIQTACAQCNKCKWNCKDEEFWIMCNQVAAYQYSLEK